MPHGRYISIPTYSRDEILEHHGGLSTEIVGMVDEIVPIMHLPGDNLWLDRDGEIILNLFEYVTIHQVKAFRADPGDCFFPMRDTPGVYVEFVADYDNPFYARKDCWDERVDCEYARLCSGRCVRILLEPSLAPEEIPSAY